MFLSSSMGFDPLPPQTRTHQTSRVCVSLQTVTLYLVKWCSLPYEDSTWELKADIDQSKIEEYERIAARTPNTTRMASICVCVCVCLRLPDLQLPNCSPQGNVLVVLRTQTHTHTPCCCGQAKPLTVCLMLNRSS